MAPDIIIKQPEVGPMQARLGGLVQRCKSQLIETQDDHETATRALGQIAGFRKEVVDLFKQPKKDAHATHRSITAAENKLLDPLDEGKKLLGRKLIKYEDDERREAEWTARKEQERQRKAEEEAALAAAQEAQDRGDTVTAEAIIEEHEEAPEPVVEAKPRVSSGGGGVTTKRWSMEVIDKIAALKHVVEHPEHLAGVELVPKYWNKLVQAQHEAFNVPGIKAACTKTKSVRT